VRIAADFNGRGPSRDPDDLPVTLEQLLRNFLADPGAGACDDSQASRSHDGFLERLLM
jgi:hypothetical protein